MTLKLEGKNVQKGNRLDLRSRLNRSCCGLHIPLDNASNIAAIDLSERLLYPADCVRVRSTSVKVATGQNTVNEMSK